MSGPPPGLPTLNGLSATSRAGAVSLVTPPPGDAEYQARLTAERQRRANASEDDRYTETPPDEAGQALNEKEAAS